VRWPSRAWSFFLHWTIGYGYRPTLVLPYLVGLFAVGSLLLNHADHAHPSKFTPTKTGPGQPGFNAARYTLDLLAHYRVHRGSRLHIAVVSPTFPAALEAALLDRRTPSCSDQH
jgi:hypothetical protein